MTDPQSLDVLIGMIVTVVLALLLVVAALALRRPEGRMVQLEAAYRRFSSSAPSPDRTRRQRSKMLVLAVLVILNMVWFGLLLSRALGERPVESTSSQTATPGGLLSSAGSSPVSAGSGSPEERTIQVKDVPGSAKPFQSVRVQGTYRGGPDTFLRVERWEGGKWLAFPLSTKTDQSGHFTTYVELGQPGRFPLRVLDPNLGVKSRTFVLVITG
jgi:hypothetical protein